MFETGFWGVGVRQRRRRGWAYQVYLALSLVPSGFPGTCPKWGYRGQKMPAIAPNALSGEASGAAVGIKPHRDFKKKKG